MRTPKAEGQIETNPGESPGRPVPSAVATPQGPAESTRQLVRVTRQAVAGIGPELRKLEELRDEWLAHLGDEAGGPAANRGGSEGERLLALLARSLEHGILGIEEGWAELEDCFSPHGLARLRRQAKAGRTAPEPERSRT